MSFPPTRTISPSTSTLCNHAKVVCVKLDKLRGVDLRITVYNISISSSSGFEKNSVDFNILAGLKFIFRGFTSAEYYLLNFIKVCNKMLIHECDTLYIYKLHYKCVQDFTDNCTLCPACYLTDSTWQWQNSILLDEFERQFCLRKMPLTSQSLSKESNCCQ